MLAGDSVRSARSIFVGIRESCSFTVDVEKYPVMTFKSTSIEATGNDQFALTGDLTIRDITRPVTLQVTRY